MGRGSDVDVRAEIARKRRIALVAAMNSTYAYKLRDTGLRMMGFASYKAYRKSATWTTIRKRVFGRSKGVCEFCGAKATEIHHSSYHRACLDGRDLTYLHAVCHDCHQYGEYGDSGRKLSPAAATERMRSPLRLDSSCLPILPAVP